VSVFWEKNMEIKTVLTECSFQHKKTMSVENTTSGYIEVSIGKETIEVNGRELIKAIENAMNTC
jgi:hypothetical protein